MNKITEAFADVDDQLDNLRAIKGDAYAKVVAFVISNFSMVMAVLKIVDHMDASTESTENAMRDISMVFNAINSNAINNYADAVGMDVMLIDEAATDAKRILGNASNHIERIMS